MWEQGIMLSIASSLQQARHLFCFDAVQPRVLLLDGDASQQGNSRTCSWRKMACITYSFSVTFAMLYKPKKYKI